MTAGHRTSRICTKTFTGRNFKNSWSAYTAESRIDHYNQFREFFAQNVANLPEFNHVHLCAFLHIVRFAKKVWRQTLKPMFSSGSPTCVKRRVAQAGAPVSHPCTASLVHEWSHRTGKAPSQTDTPFLKGRPPKSRHFQKCRTFSEKVRH